MRTAFVQFSREDVDSVFVWTAPYAIISFLAMFDEEIYPIHPSETVVEQSGWPSALLEDMLHIPRIHMHTHPGNLEHGPHTMDFTYVLLAVTRLPLAASPLRLSTQALKA